MSDYDKPKLAAMLENIKDIVEEYLNEGGDPIFLSEELEAIAEKIV